MKERLEPPYLEQIGLIPSSASISKRLVRMKTAILYKQQKFNLLREESEGFAMLCTLITSNMLVGMDAYMKFYRPKGKTVQEIKEIREGVIKSRVDFVLGSVRELIGYFDLSPSK